MVPVRIPRRLSIAGVLAHRALRVLPVLPVLLQGCALGGVAGGGPLGSPGAVKGFIGGVAADEPRAALVARDVLSSGGTAADAAVALGFALAVTMPSRAGLGGGGACVVYAPDPRGPNKGVAEALLFLPQAPSAAGQGAGDRGAGDRPAALPMLPRGLFALHARYGKLPFEQLLGTAEQMARFGISISRAFARDLAVVAGPLAADPGAASVFVPGGKPLGEGGQMTQPDLGATLSQLRVSGIGDMYQGAMARRIQDAAPGAGAALPVADLRGAVPRWVPPLMLNAGNEFAAFLPPPADGGLAAAAAFAVLRDGKGAEAAQARALAVAARWRQGGVADAAALLSASLPAASLPVLPASTSFATLDRDGNAVACALTMNNLFGTGRILPGTGILLAASPTSVTPPLLAAAVAGNTNIHAFRAASGGSGQEGAALAAASALAQALATSGGGPFTPVPEPGRANLLSCPDYLPGRERTCVFATDPRGAGLATGGG